jgi:hypothetical protein
MHWLFWALLVLGVLLLVVPFLGIVSFALHTTLWIVGAVLLIGVAAWAIITLTRLAMTPS